MKYFLSLLTLTWTTFQFARSDWTEKSFRRYRLQPDGCQDFGELTELGCALKCSATTDCVAFSYDSMAQLCSKCFQSQVTSVSVNKTMFWLRNSSLFDVMPHSYVTGDHKILIKMYGKLLPTNDTKWFHAQLEGTINGQLVLLFKLLFENSRDIQIKARTATLDWVGTKPCCSSPVLSEAGTVLDVAIIHTTLLYFIYVNSVFCCNFTNYIPYEYANSFHVHGSIALFEISF